MTSTQFEPEYLIPLIVHQTDRNKAINIPSPLLGFLGDIIRLYWGYVDDIKYYENVIEIDRGIQLQKLKHLKELIEKGKNETDPIQRKSLLINAIELKKELELLYGE